MGGMVAYSDRATCFLAQYRSGGLCANIASSKVCPSPSPLQSSYLLLLPSMNHKSFAKISHAEKGKLCPLLHFLPGGRGLDSK